MTGGQIALVLVLIVIILAALIVGLLVAKKKGWLKKLPFVKKGNTYGGKWYAPWHKSKTSDRPLTVDEMELQTIMEMPPGPEKLQAMQALQDRRAQRKHDKAQLWRTGLEKAGDLGSSGLGTFSKGLDTASSGLKATDTFLKTETGQQMLKTGWAGTQKVASSVQNALPSSKVTESKDARLAREAKEQQEADKKAREAREARTEELKRASKKMHAVAHPQQFIRARKQLKSMDTPIPTLPEMKARNVGITDTSSLEFPKHLRGLGESVTPLEELPQ